MEILFAETLRSLKYYLQWNILVFTLGDFFFFFFFLFLPSLFPSFFEFVFMCLLSLHSGPTLCGPMYCSLPGSSVYGILQARIYWSGLPCPPPGNLPYPEIKPMSLMSPALAVGVFCCCCYLFVFLTTSAT